MTTLLTVLGARPEFIKLSPVLPRLDARWSHVVVHTGQHYDHALDGIFFEELRLRQPDFRLSVGSGTHAEQTAGILTRLEPILADVQPDAVIVHGDTNTTLGGALAAVKLGIPVIHIEAGCRSFNRTMPEEINRVLVDHCAELLLPPDDIARRNLLSEGIAENTIHVVGSTVIDAVGRNVRLANTSSILQEQQLSSRGYVLCTIHRSENTHPTVLPGLVAALNTIAKDRPVVVPLHPRTRAAMHRLGVAFTADVRVMNPLGYIDLLQLLRHAQAVLTDSGGLQEEAAALSVPVLVLREETEWMYLILGGKAILVGNRLETVLAGSAVGLSDGRLAQMRAAVCKAPSGAAERTVDAIAAWLAGRAARHRKDVPRQGAEIMGTQAAADPEPVAMC